MARSLEVEAAGTTSEMVETSTRRRTRLRWADLCAWPEQGHALLPPTIELEQARHR